MTPEPDEAAGEPRRSPMRCQPLHRNPLRKRPPRRSPMRSQPLHRNPLRKRPPRTEPDEEPAAPPEPAEETAAPTEPDEEPAVPNPSRPTEETAQDTAASTDPAEEPEVVPTGPALEAADRTPAALDPKASSPSAMGDLYSDPYGEEEFDLSRDDFEAILSQHQDAFGEVKEGEIVRAKVLRESRTLPSSWTSGSRAKGPLPETSSRRPTPSRWGSRWRFSWRAWKTKKAWSSFPRRRRTS